ncbi:MAG TPA: gephyrin-like molybdotransferase Glp [Candidatus Limnocylindrales bacterium]|nr:gephyrin-like molybdotransferase Glp [Candidatus Limnocylindrales bacterium]
MAESLMRVEEAQARVLALAGRPANDPVAATEVVAVEAALGRVLAEDVAAAVTLPPWDNSAMDGYAIRADDVRAASDRAPVRLRVVGDAPAGDAPSGAPIQPGEAIRIATGAPVPPGADAIAQVELTESDEAMRGDVLPSVVGVRAAIATGAHIRRAGSDLHAGDRLLGAGTAVGPAQVALLAGAGIAEVHVHRRPRIGVLATGNEVRAADEALDGTGIPDANGPGLRALVAAAGAEAIDLGIARDELDDVLRRLRRGIEAGADAIVVAGGVSVGPYDVVKAAFEELGTVELWRVAVQPGKPFALATVPPGAQTEAPGRPILLFGLPGNPVSGFVTFELFVRPAIRVMAGRAAPLRAPDRGVLLDEARTSPGRRAYLRVTAERGPDGGVLRDGQGRAQVRLAHGTAGQGSHVLSALATAEALAIVPEEVDVHPAGGPVDLLWLDAP